MKNSKVVSFLSPFKVGQAGNLWTLPRTLYKESDIVTYVKISSLKWAGHVIGMEEQSTTRRVLSAVVGGKRQSGGPKLGWEDGVTEDSRRLGERNLRNAARNRDSWQKLLKKALAQKGLLCR